MQTPSVPRSPSPSPVVEVTHIPLKFKEAFSGSFIRTLTIDFEFVLPETDEKQGSAVHASNDNEQINVQTDQCEMERHIDTQGE